MDPLGFGFSQYDVMGRFVPEDHGVMQTGEGHIIDTDIDGTFHGPVELANKLLSSQQVKRCFAATVLAFALGRPTTGVEGLEVDEASVDAVLAGAAADGELLDLFAAFTTSDAFLLRDTTALPAGAF